MAAIVTGLFLDHSVADVEGKLTFDRNHARTLLQTLITRGVHDVDQIAIINRDCAALVRNSDRPVWNVPDIHAALDTLGWRQLSLAAFTQVEDRVWHHKFTRRPVGLVGVVDDAGAAVGRVDVGGVHCVEGLGVHAAREGGEHGAGGAGGAGGGAGGAGPERARGGRAGRGRGGAGRGRGRRGGGVAVGAVGHVGGGAGDPEDPGVAGDLGGGRRRIRGKRSAPAERLIRRLRRQLKANAEKVTSLKQQVLMIMMIDY